MFRFSIRELMLVTAIGGVCLAWWCDRQGLSASVKAAVARAEYLEWQEEKIWTIGGSISKSTFDKCLEEDWKVKERFAGQSPPKSATKK